MKKHQFGFSLIEVMISFVILGAGLLALAKFQVDVLKEYDEGRQQSQAVQYGQQKIDQFRSYVQVASCATCTDYAEIVSGTDTVTGTNASYTRTWTVSSSNNPAYKLIEMKVAWTTSKGTAKSVTINTKIVSTDPGDSGDLIGSVSSSGSSSSIISTSSTSRSVTTTGSTTSSSSSATVTTTTATTTSCTKNITKVVGDKAYTVNATNSAGTVFSCSVASNRTATCSNVTAVNGTTLTIRSYNVTELKETFTQTFSCP